MAENDAKTTDQQDDTTPQTSEGDVNTPNGPVTPGDAEVITNAEAAAPAAPDLSNTYENGIPASVGQVNTAVPADAHVVTDYNEAQDKGYFGYARGEAATEGYTLAEAGKRNARLREARINSSAEAEEQGTRNRNRGRGRGRGNS